MNFTKPKYQKIELAIHCLFWVFVFSAVNVSWQQNWFDTALRANTPSPLLVVAFPILFYAHAYWAIPRFFAARKWLAYTLSLILIFAGPELVRLLFYALFLSKPLISEISSRDSFIVGSPNISWMAFVFSFVYRLTMDRLFYDKLKMPFARESYRSVNSQAALPPKEAQKISDDLVQLMEEKKLFLQKDLDLDEVSEHLKITDKKLSTMLNQHMSKGFTDYVNAYRIQHFLEKVESGHLQNLSIEGLASQSGFSSKTTFYRAFKKIKGCTPTDYLQSVKPVQH